MIPLNAPTAEAKATREEVKNALLFDVRPRILSLPAFCVGFFVACAGVELIFLPEPFFWCCFVAGVTLLCARICWAILPTTQSAVDYALYTQEALKRMRTCVDCMDGSGGMSPALAKEQCGKALHDLEVLLAPTRDVDEAALATPMQMVLLRGAAILIQRFKHAGD